MQNRISKHGGNCNAYMNLFVQPFGVLQRATQAAVVSIRVRPFSKQAPMKHVLGVAGKSAGLILRRIHAPVLAEAHAIEVEQLAAATARWSLRDSALPPAGMPSPVPLPPPDSKAQRRCKNLWP